MPERTGGMIALLPDVESARLLALDAPGAEHLDGLHLTLASLGDDVTGWTDEHRTEATEPARTAAYLLGPLRARVFGARPPCRRSSCANAGKISIANAITG
jgi:hypothetical protein